MIYEDIEKKADEAIAKIESKREKKLAQKRKEETLKNYKGDDQIVEFSEIYEEQRGFDPEFISTGWKEVDEALGGGLRKGQLTVVSGFTGNGKTSWCFDMTRNMKDVKTLWLPFEEPAEELAQKLHIWKKECINFYTPRKIVEENSPDIFAYIYDRVLEAKIKFGIEVVFIDNLQFIMTGSGTDYDKTALLVSNLKKMASRLDVSVVLIAHLRKSKDGIHRMPTFEDITGSSDTVKLANKVIAVWKTAKKDIVTGEITYTGGTKISTQKVRDARGKLAVINFSWKDGVYTVDEFGDTEEDVTSTISKKGRSIID